MKALAGLHLTITNKGRRDFLTNTLPTKMGVWIPDGVKLNREWRRIQAKAKRGKSYEALAKLGADKTGEGS